MGDGRAGEQLGIWSLDKLIGSGGMGDVYLAHRTDGIVRQDVAVKVLRSVHKEGIPDEADMLRRLQHTHIAKCFGDGLTDDGHRYLVMEYVEGEPVTEYANRRGLSIYDRLDLLLDACAAIEYAHHHLVVHLDLKPGNILVNREGSVKVIDFGVARPMERGQVAEPSGFLSAPYASPEQIRMESGPGYAADVYALGAVLYELLCGHEPFSPLLSAGELERQILEETPRRPSVAISQPRLERRESARYVRVEPDEIAGLRGGCRLAEVRKLLVGDLDRICLFALRKEPERRYKSADDFHADIDSVLEGRRPAHARAAGPVYRALRLVRRKPLVFLAVIAVLSAILQQVSLRAEFSQATNFHLENKRRLDLVTESGLKELSAQLRPRLARDPHLQQGVDALDRVLKRAAPIPSATTTWEEVCEMVFQQLRHRTVENPSK